MPIQTRSATLDADRQDIIELLRRHLTPLSDGNRFDWLYRLSPYGPARVWVACDSVNGEIVGAAAIFPRKMYVGGIEKMAWVLGDFCLEEKYRSLGPALQLQRACLEACSEPPFEFCYDFPSKSMMAIYKRLGVSETSKLVRWAKPLRMEGKLEQIVGSEVVARGLATIGNVVLAQRGWKGTKESCELAFHHGACGEEFNALDRQLRERTGVCTVRTAEYLNWRYLRHPATPHEFMTARRNGALIGYAVFAYRAEDAKIVDVCSVEEPAVIARLLAGVVGILSQRGVMTVSLNSGESHPWNPIFQRAGFRRREATPVIASTGPRNHQIRTTIREKWYLMQGDRDS
jgi:hypothetical protein